MDLSTPFEELETKEYLCDPAKGKHNIFKTIEGNIMKPIKHKSIVKCLKFILLKCVYTGGTINHVLRFYDLV